MSDEFDKWLKHDSKYTACWPDFSAHAIELARAAFSAQSSRGARACGDVSPEDAQRLLQESDQFWAADEVTELNARVAELEAEQSRCAQAADEGLKAIAENAGLCQEVADLQAQLERGAAGWSAHSRAVHVRVLRVEVSDGLYSLGA